MPIEIRWILAQAGQIIIGFALPVVLMHYLPRPRRWWARAALVIVACWVSLVFFTTEVYCPIGIARAEHRGADNPYLRFDNNNTAPLILMGWLIPAIPIGAVGVWRWLKTSTKGSATTQR